MDGIDGTIQQHSPPIQAGSEFPFRSQKCLLRLLNRETGTTTHADALLWRSDCEQATKHRRRQVPLRPIVSGSRVSDESFIMKDNRSTESNLLFVVIPINISANRNRFLCKHRTSHYRTWGNVRRCAPGLCITLQRCYARAVVAPHPASPSPIEPFGRCPDNPTVSNCPSWPTVEYMTSCKLSLHLLGIPVLLRHRRRHIRLGTVRCAANLRPILVLFGLDATSPPIHTTRI